MRKTTGPRFCYDCGRKLWGPNKKMLIHEEMENPRTFHIGCAKELLRIDGVLWAEYTAPSVQQQASNNQGKYLPNGEEA
jgi:hypothetical protein